MVYLKNLGGVIRPHSVAPGFRGFLTSGGRGLRFVHGGGGEVFRRTDNG